MKRINIKSLIIFLAFIVLILTMGFGFLRMRQKTAELNEKTVEEIGFTYLSSLTLETANHSRTYFQGRFDILRQLLDSSLNQAETPQQFKDLIQNGIASSSAYIALLTADGEREVLRGNDDVQPYDLENFNKAVKLGNDKVVLTTDSSGERMLEMMLMSDFYVGGTKYCALLCDIPADTLNTILSLSYNDTEMVYSFIIRKQDSGFVIRNDDAVLGNYYTRVRQRYQNYNGKMPEDYISELGAAMKNGQTYQSVFLINDGENTGTAEKRMLFARRFHYSDWYLITAMRFSEMEELLYSNNQKSSQIFLQYFSLFCVVFLIVFILFAIYSYQQFDFVNNT